MALVLSTNAGSSSLKIALYTFNDDNDSSGLTLILKSSISSISSPPAHFSSEHGNIVRKGIANVVQDHATAFAHFLNTLQSETSIDRENIRYICHRVVHGGDHRAPVQITPESFHHIEALSNLAPLHNSAALSVIKACVESLPRSTSIAYFDTTFHHTIPVHISTYAIDQEVAAKKGLRKYGFHGLSYSFILRVVSEFLGKASDTVSLIVLHLGSGASACAIRNGTSLDTSMGLTPLNGLPGATRSGSVDPSLIFHYTNEPGKITDASIGVSAAEDILNRKAGWKAICGTTDFGEIVQKAELSIDEDANEVIKKNPYRLALELFVDRILHYIGSYHLKLDAQVDALVFSGGIGERSDQLRTIVAKKIACLGYIELDEAKNKAAGEAPDVVSEISKGRTCEHRGKILVVKTDEQFEMARQCTIDQKNFAL